MTKHPMTKEARMPNDETAPRPFGVRGSGFLRHWVFRHSSFGVSSVPLWFGYRYSYPMWNVIRPSGSRRMFVIWTGTPPGLAGLLAGVVYGVNAVFDFDGYGTDPRNRDGPSGPPIPCDSSNT